MSGPQYPKGKLTASDEGATEVVLYVDKNRLIMVFPKPVKWIGLDKQTALAWIETMRKRVEELTDA